MIYKFKKEVLFMFICGAVSCGVILNVIYNPKVLAKEQDESFSVIMYHHITDDDKKTGDYVISEKQLKADFEYLYNNGYKTLSVRDLLAIEAGEIKLPEKSVMITFDDGQKSFYRYAFPLLKKYNFKAVFSIIGKQTEIYSSSEDDNINYAHVIYDEIKEMVSSGLVEIGNHSYDMHNNNGKRAGVTKAKGESFQMYKKALEEDIFKFNNLLMKNTGLETKIFTYPFGKFSKETEKIIKDNGFTVAFTCYEIKNVPKQNENWLYRLGRYNRSGKYETENFFKKVLF